MTVFNYGHLLKQIAYVCLTIVCIIRIIYKLCECFFEILNTMENIEEKPYLAKISMFSNICPYKLHTSLLLQVYYNFR